MLKVAKQFLVEEDPEYDLILLTSGNIKLAFDRKQAEELYEKLDVTLWDETRAEIERKLTDLEYREDKLREAMAFAEIDYEPPEVFYDL